MGDNANNTENKSINGFVVGNDNKLRLGGRLVSKEVAELAASGHILADFDKDKIKSSRNKAAAGKTDLVAELKKISPAIEVLKVGMTARLPMPKPSAAEPKPKRKFVMSVVTKLNQVTAKGREWPGRAFESLSDDEYLYVTRLEDVEPVERKTGRGGGRKSKAASANLEASLAAAKEHLAGNGEAGTATDDQQTQAVLDGGAAVAAGGEGGTVLPPAIEEATVVRH